ncbi:hypothetical protein [Streptacidiphilus rugosus]|uniref:hypothetical protein n=1 Tax=Streptacidiphilus rugosus TaxID=405783 RepID=UPI00068ADF8C|nr:hypothetical protein [Streptacidiphilus rugosus]
MASSVAIHDGAGFSARTAALPALPKLPSLPTLLVLMGVALVPWMGVLAASGEWPWVGLDVLEAAGLISTGLLLRRGDGRAALTASATAALLLMDAWFDVMTSHGAELTQAWFLALLLELPIAGLCARLALRAR